jgi:hypothetical protein
MILEEGRKQAPLLGRQINHEARSNPPLWMRGRSWASCAGNLDTPFELILRVSVCERYMGLRSSDDVQQGGAIVGSDPVGALRVQISALSFARRVRAVARPDAACPAGLDGIASFRFLGSFTHGTFGDRHRFGLATA